MQIKITLEEREQDKIIKKIEENGYIFGLKAVD